MNKLEPGMKRIAIEACRVLAMSIHGAQVKAPLWIRADRIERRFRIQGATDYIVCRLGDARADFLAAESKRHDSQFPDRLTYLHR